MIQLDRIYNLSHLAMKLCNWLGFFPLLLAHAYLLDSIGEKEKGKEIAGFLNPEPQEGSDGLHGRYWYWFWCHS
jgi:hypothetical protein